MNTEAAAARDAELRPILEEMGQHCVIVKSPRN
jgi:hypothetical protein